MIRICICDDNLLHSNKLESFILEYRKKFLNLSIETDVYTSGETLLNNINLDNIVYQIIFLDIEMEKINGIDVARKIREKDKNVLIIYITSYDKYTLQSFEVSPFRYLIKPINYKQIEDILSQAIDEIMLNNQYLFFKFKNMQYQIRSNNIIMINSQSGRKLQITTNDNQAPLLFYGKIKEIECMLNPMVFVKVNSGTIINLNFIHIICNDDIYLTNKKIVSISRSQRKLVKQTYNDFIKRRMKI